MEDIEDRILFEARLTPPDIHGVTASSTAPFTGWLVTVDGFGAFKPSNRSPDVPGLYLAGGAAHPGPGMPMVLMSGWIAADALDRDLRRRPHRDRLLEGPRHTRATVLPSPAPRPRKTRDPTG